MPKRIDDDKLFSAVVRTLVSRGFDKATTKQIAEDGGVNEVTLFRKFGSKEGLIRAAFQHILAESPLHELAYTGDVRADLAAVVGAYDAMGSQYGEVILTMVIEIPRDPAYKDLLGPFFGVVQSVGAIIQRYQKEGVLVEEEGFSAVSALLGPIMVRKMLAKTRPDVAREAFSVEKYVEVYLGGREKE